MILHMKTKQYDLRKQTLIMGILNATPDSFSDGGKYNTIETAVAQAKQMVEDGADIIDIGGESTRPDHETISPEEEINRVIPVIEAGKQAATIPLPIDTYKAGTAEAASEGGVELMNGMCGAKKEPHMAEVAAKHGVPIVPMHSRDHTSYHSIMEDLIHELVERVAI